jgi:glucose/arabinose dehydrogenase
MVIGAAGFIQNVGSTHWAQDPSAHAGKVLRLNEDGTVPPDNPFAGRAGYEPAIYALGIRNALGLIVHPTTGEIWETENGPQGGDEINIIKAGANYGWPLVTYGRACRDDLDGKVSWLPPPGIQPPTAAPGMEEPFTYYKPSIGISGMTFYTGDKFPFWKGSLIVGGLGGTQISRIVIARQGWESRREAMLTELRQRIRDVREGPDGLLYLTTDMADGAILKIEPVLEGESR